MPILFFFMVHAMLRTERIPNQNNISMDTKYIFVTGGVVSSLGKGIISSSLARLLCQEDIE